MHHNVVDFLMSVVVPTGAAFCFIILFLGGMSFAYGRTIGRIAHGESSDPIHYFPTYTRYTLTKTTQNQYTGVFTHKMHERYIDTGWMVRVENGVARLDAGFASGDYTPDDTHGWHVEKEYVVQLTHDISESVPIGDYLYNAVRVVQEHIDNGKGV